MLHRILSNKGNVQKSDLIKFCFSCLDKFGIQASFLFEDINIKPLPLDCIQKLCSPQYMSKFNFSCIIDSLSLHVVNSMNIIQSQQAENPKPKQSKEQVKTYVDSKPQSTCLSTCGNIIFKLFLTFLVMISLGLFLIIIDFYFGKYMK